MDFKSPAMEKYELYKRMPVWAILEGKSVVIK